MEIGDRFIIDWDTIQKTDKYVKSCIFSNEEFTALEISKSGISVYYKSLNYIDRKRCKCQVCKTSPNYRSISIWQTKVTTTMKSIIRDSKIEQLLL
jgi:hypothetical protein